MKVVFSILLPVFTFSVAGDGGAAGQRDLVIVTIAYEPRCAVSQLVNALGFKIR